MMLFARSLLPAAVVATALFAVGLPSLRPVHLRGELVPGSTCREPNGARFRVHTSDDALVDVHLLGILPDTFGDDPAVALNGAWALFPALPGTELVADQVQVHCPSKYDRYRLPREHIPACTP